MYPTVPESSGCVFGIGRCDSEVVTAYISGHGTQVYLSKYL